MARPLKNTVDYFPHFVNSGKTLLILQNEFGNDGYAFWFKLLSLLCKTDGQVYDYNNPASWRLLLAETHVSEVIANGVLALLSDIGAIDTELHHSKIIWVQHLVDNLGDVYTRRKNGITPTRPVYVSKNPLNVNNNTQTRPDQTKPDQTKQEIPKNSYGEFKNVFLSEVEHDKLKAKFDSSLPDKIETLSCYKKSTGKQYKDDYATILNWARRNGGQKDDTTKTYRGNPSQKPAGAFAGLE